MESEPAWLKYASLGADYLGPVVAALFGYWILRVTKRLESSQWRNQKLVEKRIEVWDKVGPLLNDVYCYCLRIGTWKSHTPPDIVKRKREADKLTHLSRPYFSEDFFQEYQAFMNTCFQVFQGHGVDAKIRTELWEHQTACDAWEVSWDTMISDEPFDERDLFAAYNSLLAAVRSDISPADASAA